MADAETHTNGRRRARCVIWGSGVVVLGGVHAPRPREDAETIPALRGAVAALHELLPATSTLGAEEQDQRSGLSSWRSSCASTASLGGAAGTRSWRPLLLSSPISLGPSTAQSRLAPCVADRLAACPHSAPRHVHHQWFGLHLLSESKQEQIAYALHAEEAWV